MFLSQKTFLATALTISLFSSVTQACTGITLKSSDQAQIVARTIEWGASKLQSQLIVSPRGRTVQTHSAKEQTMKYQTQLGFVGVSIFKENIVVEGLNEKGLSAGLFFFPDYGQYPVYLEKNRQQTVSDMEFVAWILSNFDSVESVKKNLQSIKLTALIPEAGTLHYRVADKSGQQIVIECVDGKMKIYDNLIGVLTNSPDFPWHVKNLNNYLNLQTGQIPAKQLGDITLQSFGIGAGMVGLPGDISPTSRFVRAAYMQNSAPNLKTAKEATFYSFTILNSFEIPIGLELSHSKEETELLSATQWTSSSDMTNRIFYYKTADNARIRAVDLKELDFSKIQYQVKPLDEVSEQPIEKVRF